jgi:Domain of unknown function (DUF4338)
MTGRGCGIAASGYRKGGFGSGSKAAGARRRWKRTRRSCCWRQATRLRRRLRCGGRSTENRFRKKHVCGLAFSAGFCHTSSLSAAEASLFRYRGRELTGSDIEFIRQLIAAHPGESRSGLSVKLCQAWQLKQPNGVLRDMVCRGMLLMLDRAGTLELPPARGNYDPGVQRRKRPEAVVPDNRPVKGPLSRLLPIEIEPVRRTPREALFNSLMEQYHYLHFERPVGEHLKYLMSARCRGALDHAAQAIACAA